MTVERMIELLEIEKGCVLRNASGECNRYCSGCDLLQDDTELHEMYTEVIALLKAQEPVEPQEKREGDYKNLYCGACGRGIVGYVGHLTGKRLNVSDYCNKCGKAVKWE